MRWVTRSGWRHAVAGVAAAAGIWVIALSTQCAGDEPAPPAGDWPTVRHDVRRSGYTPQPLDVSSLGLAWCWQSDHAPRPAWYGPAKQDAFANIPALPSMRSYDLAFHVTAVGDQVFFGSSADDAVYCLDAQSGTERWSYVTDGPVRVAPTYADGFVFFGSDDGYVYCLDSQDGHFIWKYSPAAEAPKILSDGRLISPWPCRTGVLVDQGVAYFANSLLPWKHSYLCAIDTGTGQPTDGKGYQQRLDGLTMEGPMAASRELLISPQGRVPPQIFRRSNGENLGSVKGVGGGSVIVMAPDSTIFHGPAGSNQSRTGGIDASSASKMEKLASYPHGKDIVIAGRRAFLLGQKTLTANDWVDRKMQWSSACEENLSLIVAGDTVVVGGEDMVAAYSAADGQRTWSHGVDGKAHGLAVAQGRLLVSTDTGAVYGFQTGQTLSPTEALAPYESRESKPPTAEKSPESPLPLRLAAGPWLQFEQPGRAIVRWHTSQPSPSVLRYWQKDAGGKAQVNDDRPKTEHQVSLDDLKRNRVYHYVIQQPIDGQVKRTREYICDTLFDYSVAPAASAPSPFDPQDGRLDYRQVARRVLSETGILHGLCVILGSGDGQLAYELARQSRLRIIALDTDRDNVKQARASLRRAKLYGGRVAVHHVKDYRHANIPRESANLVVSQQLMSSGHFPGPARDVVQLLKPGRGVAYLGQPAGGDSGLSQSQLAAWFHDTGVQPRWVRDHAGVWASVQRELLSGAGQWTHLYGRADNSAFGGEELAGVGNADQLDLQWIGRPGPRYHADRNGRKPSPLAANGRLFLQGENRIIGMDTMNGTILWSLELPDFHRFNMPRDCSNWCADQENLYAVMRDKCWRVDAKTGNVEQFYTVVSPETRPFDWGYVSTFDNLLVGSAVREGTSWTGFHGGEGWYDAKSGPQTAKICGDNLFAVDRQTGDVQWEYRDGLVIHPTITIGGGHLYFVQSRAPALKALPSRRVESPLLWEDLVLTALDVKTGEPVWEQPIQPAPGIVTFYLAHSDQKLVLSSSTDNKYYTYAFDDDTGKPRWQTSLPWEKDHHGGHMSRPAIVAGKVYVRPHVMRLADGQVLPEKVPGGKCGTYACTRNALFFRAGTVTVWDRNQHSSSTWNRLRPDCWLSTIPADGLLLSPEGGGGCSCGVWMETSVAFKPVASLLNTVSPATSSSGTPSSNPDG